MNGTELPDDPNAPAPAASTDPLKSMKLFFIDNQGGWPDTAVLAGDLVLWPDEGKYPAFTPIASAKHPAFDGTVIVQAGNRGLIVTLCAGANTMPEVRTAMSAKGAGAPEQYRIAVDAIVHRIMLWRALDKQEQSSVHPFALLQWLQTAHPKEAAVIQKALKQLYAKPEAVLYHRSKDHIEMMDRQDVHEHAEAMLDQLSEVSPQDIMPGEPVLPPGPLP